MIWLTALLIVGFAFAQLGVGQRALVNERGWALAWRFIRAAAYPDFSSQMLQIAYEAALVTLAYAVIGTALSLLIGAIGGLISSERWWQVAAGGSRRARPIWLAVRGAFAVPRAIHEAVWGLIFISVLGLDPLAAVLAIALPFGAITAKVFAEILDETPTEPLLTLTSAGVPPLRAMVYTLIPQAFPELLAYAFYRLECAIRAATILGLIGAGGLGFQVLLSLQSLRYEQMWTLFYALMLLSGATDLWSGLVRRQLQVAGRFDSCTTTTSHSAAPVAGRWMIRGSVLAVAALLPVCWWAIQVDVRTLVAPRTLTLIGSTAASAWPPRGGAALLAELVSLSAQTLAMSVLAMLIAGAGGLLLSFAAARPTTAGPARTVGVAVSRCALLLFRAVSEPVWALLALFVLFPGILPGAVGLGLYNLGIIGRLMADVLEHTDERPAQTLRAQGASAAQSHAYATLPQIMPRFLAYLLYRWDVCVRATVAVGLVGAGGLGRLLSDQLTRFDYRGVTTTLCCFLVLTFAVDLLSAGARRLLRT